MAELVELFIELRNVKKEEIDRQEKIVTNLYEKGCAIAEDYLHMLREYEQKTQQQDIDPEDIIRELELQRENMHVRRVEARAILQMSYWERDKVFKKFIHGISLILYGDDTNNLMEIPNDDYGRRGHTLLDILSYYRWIKADFKGDKYLIMEELRRMMGKQYDAVEQGTREMTEGYVEIIEKLNRNIL